jgi:rSAM/selenodomain-associated transferase 1
MKSDKLLIIFVKNILLGKVKTRLAKSIGDKGAFEVYKELVEITESETNRLKGVDIQVYFSDVIIEEKWRGHEKFVQEGADLGERMKNAFKSGFDAGYKQVIGIGSDLPDLNADIILEGIDCLDDCNIVFGPAEDGGYYLLGMNQMNNCIFDDKEWSTEGLLENTLIELHEKNLSYKLLIELNDIDTIEDLMSSSIANNFKHLYELS